MRGRAIVVCPPGFAGRQYLLWRTVVPRFHDHPSLSQLARPGSVQPLCDHWLRNLLLSAPPALPVGCESSTADADANRNYREHPDERFPQPGFVSPKASCDTLIE